MDLKSGRCLWPDQNPGLPMYPPLTASIGCDVAVVGAGVTGALIGYALTRAGFDVVMFDKRNVARGSTSASTALVLYEIDTPLVLLKRMIGAKRAVRAYHLCRDAIDQIGCIVAPWAD